MRMIRQFYIYTYTHIYKYIWHTILNNFLMELWGNMRTEKTHKMKRSKTSRAWENNISSPVARWRQAASTLQALSTCYCWTRADICRERERERDRGEGSHSLTSPSVRWPSIEMAFWYCITNMKNTLLITYYYHQCRIITALQTNFMTEHLFFGASPENIFHWNHDSSMSYSFFLLFLSNGVHNGINQAPVLRYSKQTMWQYNSILI